MKNIIYINQSEDVKFAIVLGCFCDFKFYMFIDLIARKIIEARLISEIKTTLELNNLLLTMPQSLLEM